MASSHPLDRRTDGSPYPSWGNFAVIGLRAAVGVVAMAVADEEQAGSDPVTDGTVDRIDAFVSYRRSPEDTAFVDELQDALTARGKHVWIDRAEIEPASDWSARISRGIRSARAFIFVITAESVISRECLRELQAAVDLRKLIIPVLPQDLGPMTGLPESLTLPNWIFFTDRQGRPNERAPDQGIQPRDEALPWRDAHPRLAVRAQEWAGAGRDRSFLLHGSDLHQAEEWLQGAAQHQATPPT